MAIRSRDIQKIVNLTKKMVKEQAEWNTIVTFIDIKLKTLLERQKPGDQEARIPATYNIDKVYKEIPGFDVMELKDGKVLCISKDDDDGYCRVGVYATKKAFRDSRGVVVSTEQAVDAALEPTRTRTT